MRGERRVAGWVACILGALLAGGGAAVAGDWPEFRGPTAMGISTAKDLPVRWSSTENVVWKQEIPGTGWSSPVLRDGRVYLTTAVETDSGGL
jgi:outer membrane protein assembly factor BamB